MNEGRLIICNWFPDPVSAALPRGDLRRVAVAWALSRKTSLRQSWIAERLSMRSAGNVSEQVRKFAKKTERCLPKEIRK